MRGEGGEPPVSQGNEHGAEEVRRLVVAVVTYRRPRLLAELLPRLVEQAVSVREWSIDAEVLVVDNDPEGSARSAVDGVASDGESAEVPVIRYVREPSPGIAAARNRALAESAHAHLLAFIDDDETPSSQWLRLLVSTQQQFGCAGVLGRVVPEYEVPPDPWIESGGFFVRPQQPTGSTRQVGFTGNLLLDLERVRELGLSFAEEFGLSGGEDTLFTTQLTERAGPLRWCNEAFVLDHIPASRSTREWVLNRRFREGVISSRIDLALQPGPGTRALRRIVLTGRGALRVAAGGARSVGGRVTGSTRHDARGLRTAYRGAGTVMGAWGHVHEEYSRPPGAR